MPSQGHNSPFSSQEHCLRAEVTIGCQREGYGRAQGTKPLTKHLLEDLPFASTSQGANSGTLTLDDDFYEPIPLAPLLFPRLFAHII